MTFDAGGNLYVTDSILELFAAFRQRVWTSVISWLVSPDRGARIRR